MNLKFIQSSRRSKRRAVWINVEFIQTTRRLERCTLLTGAVNPAREGRQPQERQRPQLPLHVCRAQRLEAAADRVVLRQGRPAGSRPQVAHRCALPLRCAPL